MSDNGWIPVSECLPEPDTEVLGLITFTGRLAEVLGGEPGEVAPSCFQLVLRYKWNGYDGAVDWRESWSHDEVDGDGSFAVTHWMPLPQPPGR
jgi:hypothetical protein